MLDLIPSTVLYMPINFLVIVKNYIFFVNIEHIFEVQTKNCLREARDQKTNHYSYTWNHHIFSVYITKKLMSKPFSVLLPNFLVFIFIFRGKINPTTSPKHFKSINLWSFSHQVKEWLLWLMPVEMEKMLMPLSGLFTMWFVPETVCFYLEFFMILGRRITLVSH